MKAIKFIGISTLGFIISTSAVAGNGPGVIVTPGSANAIPSLSGYMLIVLSLLLFVVAFRISKNQRFNGTPMMLITAIGLGSILSLTGGVKLVSDAEADGGNSGVKVIPPFQGETFFRSISSTGLNIVENNSGAVQRIVDIQYDPLNTNCSLRNTPTIQGTPECNVNDIISVGANGLCYVDCRPQLVE